MTGQRDPEGRASKAGESEALDPAVREQRIHQFERIISNLLRIGVSLSLLILVGGTVLSFVHHPEYLRSRPELHNLTGHGAAFPHSMEQVWAGLKEGRGQAVVVVGLLLLIVTPVLRVAVSVVSFAMQHDWMFVGIASAVLCLLILAFLLGAVE